MYKTYFFLTQPPIILDYISVLYGGCHWLPSPGGYILEKPDMYLYNMLPRVINHLYMYIWSLMVIVFILDICISD